MAGITFLRSNAPATIHHDDGTAFALGHLLGRALVAERLAKAIEDVAGLRGLGLGRLGGGFGQALVG
jgi:hypothetical protein